MGIFMFIVTFLLLHLILIRVANLRDINPLGMFYNIHKWWKKEGFEFDSLIMEFILIEILITFASLFWTITILLTIIYFLISKLRP